MKKKARVQKKILVLGGIGLGIVILVVVLFVFLSNQLSPSSTTVVTSTSTPATATPATPVPTPVQVVDPLTGLLVDPTIAQNPVSAVMVENLYPDARPQSGLSQAGLVYEALAEGGITRFMAVYQEPFPTSIGPVRSLRPYYLEWALEHNIPVAHAGGSQPALAEVVTSHLKNIDALVYVGNGFSRTSDRLAPHNLYTSDAQLSGLVSKLGFATAPTFQPLPRKVDTPAAVPTHPTINISFSTSPYAVKYSYDTASNSYARFMGGTAHIDRNTNQQIMVKNVVVQFVGTTYSTQPDGKPETDLKDIGSGKVLVFTDGGVTIGTWSKASASAQTQFVDSNSQPIAFNPGNTWISVVPSGNAVTY